MSTAASSTLHIPRQNSGWNTSFTTQTWKSRAPAHWLPSTISCRQRTSPPQNPEDNGTRGNHVEHWLNGKKVLEFERGSEQFRAAIAKSKFKNRDKFGEAKEGCILLQDHGGGIAFRNIRIRVLDE
ncbi:MAG: 3-keto-disaccharide hydrolase [Planctomycetota bacterium]